ncbi:hypothetical protein [Halothiobacillus sp. DCM-1]|uniref:hypothetical protein n=1 Tax=Halothiobacillus sp. DCM-1 TaxID=3112558 RepID=UPI00324E9500
MRRPVLWMVLLALVAGLGGCLFNHGPDDSSVRQILQDQLDPSATVLVVQKIDALNAAKQPSGQWQVDVTATLLFKQSAETMATTLDRSQPAAGFLGKIGQLGLILQFGNFKAGQTLPYQTRLTLLQGSAGWMPASR